MQYTAFKHQKSVLKFVTAVIIFSSTFLLTFRARAVEAKKTTVNTNAPAAPSRMPAGISDSQKNLEIRGQSRNLSMLLILKNRHENIDFVKPRDSYREEIQKTGF